MHKCLSRLFVLLLLTSTTLYAEEEVKKEGNFLIIKELFLKNLGHRKELIEKAEKCAQAATSPETLKSCREELKEGMKAHRDEVKSAAKKHREERKKRKEERAKKLEKKDP